MTERIRYPWFVKGDLDGFFGLAVDNLVQVLVIVALCKSLCGFDDVLLYQRVLPGVAVSLLIGNVYYALHARRVARRDGNTSCTALPYGINTPSVFAYILFVMKPVYDMTLKSLTERAEAPMTKADAVLVAGHLAWQIGLVACIGSGIIEFLGAFIGGWVRRVTPRAALLSALAAIGIIFIASPFAFQIFERPLVALVPLFIVLTGYFARVRMPLGLPSGFAAVLVGTLLAWSVPRIGGLGPEIMSVDAIRAAVPDVHFANFGVEAKAWVLKFVPVFCWKEIVELYESRPDLLWAFLGVIIPMGLINAVGSLQNIESAEAAGDKFSTGPCMAVNGIGTIAAGLFGSCFPTTIYIGHPGWKALGARSGYSILNGLFFTAVFLLGLGQLIVAIIPMEAGMAIVLWIGIVIAAQSYEVVPTRHFPAVAIGFFPAVAMMAVLLIPDIMIRLGATGGILPLITQHGTALETIRTDSWWPIGVYALAGANSGFVITCMLISAISAFLIDRQFKAAAITCFIAAVLTIAGFQHAYRIEPGKPSPQELLVWQRSEPRFTGTKLALDVPPGTFLHRGYRIAAGYAAAGLMLAGIHAARQRKRGFDDIAVDLH